MDIMRYLTLFIILFQLPPSKQADPGGLIRLDIPIPDSVKTLLTYPEDSLLNFTEIVTKYGYECEEHTVITEDGYLLTTFRVRNKPCDGRGPPVYLLHGFLESADVFLDLGPGAALVYYLADGCYDLWVGNFRGNYYARRHLYLDPDKDAEFWQFSPDEMGSYDVPASIDYILEVTGASQLSFIGYSEGGVVGIITCSDKPEYNNKINIFIGLAPGVRLLNSKSVFLRLIIGGVDLADKSGEDRVEEILFKGGVVQSSLEAICVPKLLQFASYILCSGFLNVLDSFDPGVILESTIMSLYAHFPAGTSVRFLAQINQAYYRQDFQKYDFGNEEENENEYGSPSPPVYNLSLVTVPVVIIQGRSDNIVNPVDTEWLAGQLGDARVQYIEDPKWNHLHMVYHKDGPTQLHPVIGDILSQYRPKRQIASSNSVKRSPIESGKSTLARLPLIDKIIYR